MVDRILTADDVAEFLRVRKNRVYELVRMGVIPHFRLGHQIRFSERVLMEWVNGGKEHDRADT